MTFDNISVFIILAITIGLFVSDRIRLDLVALMSMLALLLTEILTPSEALAGFSKPIVLMIAGLFVVGGGLFHTGVAHRLGEWLGRIAGTNELRLMAIIMVVTAGLSGFMSSTGTVAVMLPVVVHLARNANLSPSRLLIPLSYASLLGGMLTLIGTPPNIVVSDQLREQGLEPFRFFTFTPVGLIMLGLGIVFMLSIGRRLLPNRSLQTTSELKAGPEKRSGRDLVGDYGLSDNILRFKVPADPSLVNQTIANANVRNRFQGTILDIEREGHTFPKIGPDTVLREHDILIIQISEEYLGEVKRREADRLEPSRETNVPIPRASILVEVLLTPRSSLIGHTLKAIHFHEKYRANVLSIKRGKEPVEGNPAETILRFGDTLLVEGRRESIGILQQEHRNFVVITEDTGLEETILNTNRAPLAISIMLGMLVLMSLGLVSNVTAVLLAAVAMVLTRCLSAVEAYRSINMESVVVIAGIVPMATALQKTGGMQLIVDGLMSFLGSYGSGAIMAGLFVITSLFSQVISNTATTLLIAPMAFHLAKLMEVSPEAFLVTVAIAASTAFATPIASPTNTLVLDQGKYRFLDFVKVGIPLQMVIFVATLLVVPQLF